MMGRYETSPEEYAMLNSFSKGNESRRGNQDLTTKQEAPKMFLADFQQGESLKNVTPHGHHLQEVLT
jgi:hypothetical protein